MRTENAEAPPREPDDPARETAERPANPEIDAASVRLARALLAGAAVALGIDDPPETRETSLP